MFSCHLILLRTFRISSSRSRRHTHGFGITHAHVNLEHYTEKGDRETEGCEESEEFTDQWIPWSWSSIRPSLVR